MLYTFAKFLQYLSFFFTNMYNICHFLCVYIIRCRVLGPRSSSFTRILGLWPKLRIRICPRRRSLCQRRLCWWIKRWDLVIIAQESMPSMKVSSACLAVALRDGLSTRVTIPEIRLEWISIAETSDKEESQNILGESCYLCIKCTAANSLAALMWR